MPAFPSSWKEESESESETEREGQGEEEESKKLIKMRVCVIWGSLLDKSSRLCSEVSRLQSNLCVCLYTTLCYTLLTSLFIRTMSFKVIPHVIPFKSSSPSSLITLHYGFFFFTSWLKHTYVHTHTQMMMMSFVVVLVMSGLSDASIGYFESYGWPSYGIVKPFWMTPFSAHPSRSVSRFSRKHDIVSAGVIADAARKRRRRRSATANGILSVLKSSSWCELSFFWI